MLISSLIFTASAIVATPLKLPAPKIDGAPPVGAMALRVTKAETRVADFWFVGGTGRRDAGTTRTNFSGLGDGKIVGVVRLHKVWRDYRDRDVPAGTYLLRYRIQPILKDHAGTSEWRDFLTLEPSDPKEHPFVMALVPAEVSEVCATVAGVRVGIVIEGTGNIGL
jgi:hypothetical protein